MSLQPSDIDNPSAVNVGDFGLSLEQLKGKYGPGEHPDHIREDWRHDVAQGDTNLGYWEWVVYQVESRYYDPCDHCGKAQCDKVDVPDSGLVCNECAADWGENT